MIDMGLILFLGALFIAVGLLVTRKNAAHVFTRYSHLPYKERSAIDATEEAVGFRRFHFFLGGSLILFGLAIYYLLDPTAGMLFAVFYPLAGYLFFMARSYRQASGKESRALTLGIVVLAGSILLVVLLMRWGFATNEIRVSADMLEISGPYGEKIRASDIAAVSVVDSLPDIKAKMNGFAVGRIAKGFFLLRGGETVKLLIDGKSGPYLLLRRMSGDRLYYASPSRRADELAREIHASIPSLPAGE
jgi:hypothetical protein